MNSLDELQVFRRERQRAMSAKRGADTLRKSQSLPTARDDWSDAFVTHSVEELRHQVATRRAREPAVKPKR